MHFEFCLTFVRWYWRWCCIFITPVRSHKGSTIIGMFNRRKTRLKNRHKHQQELVSLIRLFSEVFISEESCWEGAEMLMHYGRGSARQVSDRWDEVRVHVHVSVRAEVLEASVWANIQVRRRERWTEEMIKELPHPCYLWVVQEVYKNRLKILLNLFIFIYFYIFIYIYIYK